MVLPVTTVQELAALLGCDHYRIHDWVAQGKLAVSMRIGRMLLFDESQVERAKGLIRGEGMTKRTAELYQRLPNSTPTTAYVAKRDAAALVGVDEATLVRWVKAGKLAGYTLQGRDRVLFARTDVDRLASERHGGRAA